MAKQAKSPKAKKPTASKAASPPEIFDVITPPNVLKVKVGGAGAPFDEDAIARADANLKDLSLNFTAWLQDDVQRLHDAFKALQATNGSTAARGALQHAAHELKGEAASLGLPLLGRVAASLSTLMLEKPASPFSLIADHAALIETLFKEGAGGETRHLAAVDALERAVAAL